MNIQFKKGVIELCLFSLVRTRDYYAYELIKTLANNFKVEEGALYPLLRRLTTEGYLETYYSEEMARKYYRLTEKGKEAHKNYYTEWYSLINRVNQIIEEDNTNG